MIDTNYNIEAFEYLLDKECLSDRYYLLIQYKEKLINNAHKLGCKTKDDLFNLSDSKIKKLGLKDEETIKLFKRFLTLYDPSQIKFKEIDKLNLEPKEKRAYKELYYLPGVKQTRASLYYLSGFKTLKAIAKYDVNKIINKTALTIKENKLSCIVPLPKEVRTHIAVAKAFTENK